MLLNLILSALTILLPIGNVPITDDGLREEFCVRDAVRHALISQSNMQGLDIPDYDYKTTGFYYRRPYAS